MCDRVCVCVIFGASACVAQYLNVTTSRSVRDSLCFLSLFPSFLYLSFSAQDVKDHKLREHELCEHELRQHKLREHEQRELELREHELRDR